MIFPIGDTQVKGGAFPFICYGLLIVNVLVFLYEWGLMSSSEEQINQFIITYGAIPQEIMHGQDLSTLVTSMFLHGGWMHLIGNMLFLWVFADNIEATIGNFAFIIFYLIGGLAASAAHIAFNMDSTIPTVGASGAISAVMGAYMVMFPKSRIKVLVVIFFRSFYMSAVIFLGLWIVQQLIAGVGSLSSAAESSGVAWWAHIGGFVFGVLAGLFFKSKVRLGPESYSR